MASSAAKEKSFLKYMNSLSKYPVLPKSEEFKLATEYRKTKDPRIGHKLVTANLKFVAKIAYKYSNTGHEMMDLIQQGNEGLISALRKFDPDKGYKFITYAVWWIKAHINRYIIDNHSQVKLGTTQAQRKLFFRLRSERAKLVQEKQKENVTAEELAELLDCDAKDIEEMEVRLAGRDFSLQSSLDSENENTTYQDRLVDSHMDQLSMVEQNSLANTIAKQIGEMKLNEKEKYIIKHRLMNTDPLTLQEIGDKFNVSRERIRQIEAVLLDKLRDVLSDGKLSKGDEGTGNQPASL
jgi:RNA polymerase sigma-32 factor